VTLSMVIEATRMAQLKDLDTSKYDIIDSSGENSTVWKHKRLLIMQRWKNLDLRYRSQER
jgi:hypothetical protein